MLPVSAIGLRMVAAANLVEVAALVGDTARATMLNALMGGQSLTATELAYCANVSRSTASGHLSKLVAARLLTVIRDHHLKGLVGARILHRLLELGWLKCVSDSRALQLTSSGKAGLSETFQIETNNEGVLTCRLCDPRRLTA